MFQHLCRHCGSPYYTDSKSTGPYPFCGNPECQNRSKELKEISKQKRHLKNIQLYGENYLKDRGQKSAKTLQLKDPGLKNRNLKSKQTKLEKYGSETFNNYTKIQQTKLEKYGYETFNNRLEAKKTCLEKYGVPNVSQAPEIHKKKIQTFLCKYGSTWNSNKHIENREFLYDRTFWLLNFASIKSNTLVFDFDKIHDFFKIDDQTTRKILDELEIDYIRKSNTKKLQIKAIGEISESLGDPLHREYQIPETRLKVDGYDSNTNTIYEFLGDYWHGNLRYLNGLNRTCKESFEDLNSQTFQRFDRFLSLGYNIKYIWELDYQKFGLLGLNDYIDYEKKIKDFLKSNGIPYTENLFLLDHNIQLLIHRMEASPKYQNKFLHKQTVNSPQRIIHLFTPYIDNLKKFNVLKNVILHACGKSQFKEYARNLDICVKPAIETKQFFEENNINGYRNAKYSVCLTKNGEILMAYAIGHAYFGKGKYDAEIARGACKLGYSIVGGASKIWNYIVKKFNFKTIVYYVDLNFYDGRSINFLENCKKVSEGPGFWNYWIRTKELKNREPSKHKEIMALVKEGEILEIQNAGTQVNVWCRE